MARAMSPLRRCFIIAFWLAVAFAYVAAILPGSEAPSLGGSDKLDHVAAFFTITFLGRAAYPRLGVPLLLGAMVAFGGLIELTQAIPFIHRDAEWNDWFADILATLIGLALSQPFALLVKRRRAQRASAAERGAPEPREP